MLQSLKMKAIIRKSIIRAINNILQFNNITYCLLTHVAAIAEMGPFLAPHRMTNLFIKPVFAVL